MEACLSGGGGNMFLVRGVRSTRAEVKGQLLHSHYVPKNIKILCKV